MNFQEILCRFEKIKKQGRGYLATCPVHGDKNPSLSVSMNEGGDKVLMFCHAGCDSKDILQAVELSEKDLYVENWNRGNGGNGKKLGDHISSNVKGEITTKYLQDSNTAFYIYRDPEGQPVMAVSRFKTGDNKKGFCQYRYTGCDKWAKGLNNTSPILYNLPAVIQAIAAGENIFIVEGEKDCETLKEIGLTGTTSPMGAGKWKDIYSSYLQGARVVILPDNDRPGQDHANQVLKSLQGIAKEVKIIDLPGLQDKQDISDWLQLGMGDKNKLLQLVEHAAIINTQVEERRNVKEEKKELPPLIEFSLQDLMKEEFPPLKFLVDKILPEGLTILAGKQKTGKSVLALNMAISIAKGINTMGGKLSTCKTGVAYFAIEDTKRRLQARALPILQQLNKCGENIPDNFFFLNNLQPLQNGGIEQLNNYLNSHPDIGLIVIDTIGRVKNPSYRGNSYEVDTQLYSQIHDLYLKRGVSILALTHRKKGETGDIMDSVTGSAGGTAVADTILVLERNRNENEGTLQVMSREAEEQKLAVRLNIDLFSWELLGDSEVVNQSKERKEIIDIFISEDSPLSNRQLTDLTGKPFQTMRMLTYRMEKSGILRKVDSNKYILSSSYFLSSSCSSSSTCSSSSSSSNYNSATVSATVNTTSATVDINTCSTYNPLYSKENIISATGATGATVDISKIHSSTLEKNKATDPKSKNFSLTFNPLKVKCITCKNFDCINSIKQIGRCVKGIVDNGYSGSIEHICNDYLPVQPDTFTGEIEEEFITPF